MNTTDSVSDWPPDSIPDWSPEQWQKLEEAARETAALGGFSAMRFYNNALAESGALEGGPNSSTQADEFATLAVL